MMEMNVEKKLQVRNLRVSFRTNGGKVQAVRNITFDLHKNRFTLVCDPLSSYLNTGTIELDGKITATTDDGKYTYIFEVVDNDTIRFVQNGSSDIASRLEGDPLADGTEFKFCDRR